MLQRLAYASRAQWLCAAWLAVVVAAAPAAFAQEGAPKAEGSPDAAEAPSEAAEAPPEAGQAAPRSAPTDGVEVIRVKGRALTEIDTEVPASATQFDAEAIQALGAQNVSDLSKITPNLEIRTSGSTTATFFIRGVGLSDYNANAGGAVAIYRDGVALNSPALQLGQLFDVENVEVLRGPQAKGEGRNASAGAIRISARKPVGDLSAYLNSSYGNLDYQNFEGGVEFPIVEENLAGRLSFRTVSRDGWGENGCGGLGPVGERPPIEPINTNVTLRAQGGYCGEGQTGGANPQSTANPPIAAGLPTAVNDLGNWAARGLFRYQPEGTDMDWLLIARGGKTDQLSTLGQAIGTLGSGNARLYPNGITRAVGSATGRYRDPDIFEMCERAGLTILQCNNGPFAAEAFGRRVAERGDIRHWRGDYNRVGRTMLDTWGTTLSGSVPLGPVRLGSISSYDAYDRFRDEDNDFTPDVMFEGVTNDKAWQFFQDVRLDGELEDRPLRWELGGYYLMEKLSSNATLWRLTSPFNPITRQLVPDLHVYTQDLYSAAGYAGFAWDFLDDFTLEGGVRYNWESKVFDQTYQSGDGALLLTQEERIWQAPTGSLSLTYRLREDASVYWKYSHGWKGGQFNATGQARTGIPPAEPEEIDAWEIGLNGNFADGRAGLSTALFYYKYFGYQVFVVTDSPASLPVIQIINANQAQVYGAEIEARLEPLALDPVARFVPDDLEGLRLGASFSWLESEFLEFTENVLRQRTLSLLEPSVLIPFTIDHSGNQLINSPRFKAAINAEWTFDLGRFGSLAPRYDGAWSDEIFFDANEGRGTPNTDGEFFMPKYATGQPAFWLHNLALTYTLPTGNVQISGWVRNVTDEVYKVYAFDVTNFAGIVVNFFGEPRTFGGTVSLFW